MKNELLHLMGGTTQEKDCASVQYDATTHETPDNMSDEEKKAEDKFWDDWYEDFFTYCVGQG